MSASLTARRLTVSRGPLVVLDDVDLTLTPGHRVGLTGPNGVGKSTLLGALAGRVELDRGAVELAPPAANVGLLPQEPERSGVETVRAFLERRSGVHEAQVELDAATARDVFEATRDRHGSNEPRGHCKIAINDRMTDWDAPVSDGDTVLLFPPVAGG